MSDEPIEVEQNPFRAGLESTRTPGPTSLVIFGATGDLTRRKLLPALYNLSVDSLLPSRFAMIGFARRDKKDEQFRTEAKEDVAKFSRRSVEDGAFARLAAATHYVRGEFGDPKAYASLKKSLDSLAKEKGTGGNRLFYLATPPANTREILENLSRAGLLDESDGAGTARVIIEKPFGRDLESARALNRDVQRVLAEKQTFRIDHYLGKETVQNILAFRFANGIVERLWNRECVDHVQITVAEEIGVEGRGAFYEQTGILRDIFQNHLLQLLTLVAMEPPADFGADDVRDEKLKVLRSIRPFTPDEAARFTVRGQYVEGAIRGERVPGYREEDGVKKTSETDTYAAARFHIDNFRWSGVPFYLRTGKRLARRVTEIAVGFKKAPSLLFDTAALDANALVIRIQPDEGISLRFGAKVPGPANQLRPVLMDFRYGTSFGFESPEAYERLILDAMVGDSTLFNRADEVEEEWKLVTAILDAWGEGKPKLVAYEAGTWGPKDSDALLAREGRRWRRL